MKRQLEVESFDIVDCENQICAIAGNFTRIVSEVNCNVTIHREESKLLFSNSNQSFSLKKNGANELRILDGDTKDAQMHTTWTIEGLCKLSTIELKGKGSLEFQTNCFDSQYISVEMKGDGNCSIPSYACKKVCIHSKGNGNFKCKDLTASDVIVMALRGAGTIRAANISTPFFGVSIWTLGNVMCENIKCDKTTIEVQDTGGFHCGGGNIGFLTCSNSGSGNILLPCNVTKALVTTRSAGNVTGFHVTDVFDGMCSGSGNVCGTVKNGALVQTRCFKSGKIIIEDA